MDIIDRESVYKRDNELIDKVKNGDIQAGFILAENYRPLVIKYANMFFREDPGLDVENIIQDTILYIGENIHKYDENRSKVITYVNLLVLGYLPRLVNKHKNRTNRLVSLYKNVGRGEDFLLNFISNDYPEPIDKVIQRETRDYVREHISKLSKDDEKLIKMVIKSRSLEDIAQKNGWSNAKTKERYKRILSRLKKSMIDYTEKDY